MSRKESPLAIEESPFALNGETLTEAVDFLSRTEELVATEKRGKHQVENISDHETLTFSYTEAFDQVSHWISTEGGDSGTTSLSSYDELEDVKTVQFLKSLIMTSDDIDINKELLVKFDGNWSGELTIRDGEETRNRSLSVEQMGRVVNDVMDNLLSTVASYREQTTAQIDSEINHILSLGETALR